MGALPEPERLGQDSVVLWIVGAGYRNYRIQCYGTTPYTEGRWPVVESETAEMVPRVSTVELGAHLRNFGDV